MASRLATRESCASLDDEFKFEFRDDGLGDVDRTGVGGDFLPRAVERLNRDLPDNRSVFEGGFDKIHKQKKIFGASG